MPSTVTFIDDIPDYPNPASLGRIVSFSPTASSILIAQYEQQPSDPLVLIQYTEEDGFIDLGIPEHNQSAILAVAPDQSRVVQTTNTGSSASIFYPATSAVITLSDVVSAGGISEDSYRAVLSDLDAKYVAVVGLSSEDSSVLVYDAVNQEIHAYNYPPGGIVAGDVTVTSTGKLVCVNGNYDSGFAGIVNTDGTITPFIDPDLEEPISPWYWDAKEFASRNGKIVFHGYIDGGGPTDEYLYLVDENTGEVLAKSLGSDEFPQAADGIFIEWMSEDGDIVLFVDDNRVLYQYTFSTGELFDVRDILATDNPDVAMNDLIANRASDDTIVERVVSDDLCNIISLCIRFGSTEVAYGILDPDLVGGGDGATIGGRPRSLFLRLRCLGYI